MRSGCDVEPAIGDVSPTSSRMGGPRRAAQRVSVQPRRLCGGGCNAGLARLLVKVVTVELRDMNWAQRDAYLVVDHQLSQARPID